MHEIAFDLLLLLGGIWVVAVTLRPLGLPTVMGELIVGVVLGPAVLGLIEPVPAIQLLAEIGIFFLMFHAGVETQPLEFYDALKRSLGVAIVGAIVPFSVSFGVAMLFGLDIVGAVFVGLTMTATAVVITLKSLKDLGLANTRVARVIIASCVIDDMITLVVFGLVIGVLSGGSFEAIGVLITLGKVISFFVVALLLGRFVYPRLTLPFRAPGGKGFTFVLLMALAAGLFAEAIGLHMILGAYLAGLFFEEKVAHPSLVRVVKDRAYGIAYSFLGPIFFISLGFSITFDISASGVAFIALLTFLVIVGQILSAGGMALRIGLPKREALTVGVGMCGRAEMAFILASLALAQGAIDQSIFTALIFTCFILNLFTPLGLKGCANLLAGSATRIANATRGVLQFDKFGESDGQDDVQSLRRSLPNLEGSVVIYSYRPALETLLNELESRGVPRIFIEEDESVARRLQSRGEWVVLASIADGLLDLQPLSKARAMVVAGPDDLSALLSMGAREHGFSGPIVALVDNPFRRASVHLVGVSAAFTPTHLLAATVAVRASVRIQPRITGIEPFQNLLEVAEIRVTDDSPLAHRSLAEAKVRERTGVHIVGRWLNGELHSPPTADHPIEPGVILVGCGTPSQIQSLSEMVRPITQEGTIVVAGYGGVGRHVAQILREADEDLCVIGPDATAGVDVVGDVLDQKTLERGNVRDARVVIVAGENDGATVLAVTLIRDFAPHVPIIACAEAIDMVSRLQKAGADFALSLSQITGQILIHHTLGEMISQQPRIRLAKVTAGALAGRHPHKAKIRELTGCTVVGVQRNGAIIMDIPLDFKLISDDGVFICGTTRGFTRFYQEFGDSSSA